MEPVASSSAPRVRSKKRRAADPSDDEQDESSVASSSCDSYDLRRHKSRRHRARKSRRKTSERSKKSVRAANFDPGQEPPQTQLVYDALHDVPDDRATYSPEQQAKWEQMFDRLQAYKEKHGHTRVPEMHEDSKLVHWVGNQRKALSRRQRGLTSSCIDKKRIDMLNSIGFEWARPRVTAQGSNKRRSWEYMFQRLCEFQESHGHTRVSSITDSKLATWMRNQRTSMSRKLRGLTYRCLNQLRVDMLDSIRFTWVASKEEIPCQDEDCKSQDEKEDVSVKKSDSRKSQEIQPEGAKKIDVAIHTAYSPEARSNNKHTADTSDDEANASSWMSSSSSSFSSSQQQRKPRKRSSKKESNRKKPSHLGSNGPRSDQTDQQHKKNQK